MVTLDRGTEYGNHGRGVVIMNRGTNYILTTAKDRLPNSAAAAYLSAPRAPLPSLCSACCIWQPFLPFSVHVLLCIRHEFSSCKGRSSPAGKCWLFLCSLQDTRLTLSLQISRRSMATVSDSPLSKKVEMTNWEHGHYINYQKMSENLSIVRQRLNRPLTFAEKIL